MVYSSSGTKIARISAMVQRVLKNIYNEVEKGAWYV